ncbi:hypothetical protein MKW92_005325, partial [Papaver armeniacum]
IVSAKDLNPPPAMWHEDYGRTPWHDNNGRKPWHDDNGRKPYHDDTGWKPLHDGGRKQWHGDNGRKPWESGRQNPPGTIFGRELGEAAGCLVVNSLKLPKEVQMHAVPPPYNGTAHYTTGKVGDIIMVKRHVRPVPVPVLLTRICPSHTILPIPNQP